MEAKGDIQEDSVSTGDSGEVTLPSAMVKPSIVLRKSLPNLLPDVDDSLLHSEDSPKEHIYQNFIFPQIPTTAQSPIPPHRVKSEATSNPIAGRSDVKVKVSLVTDVKPIDSFNAYDSDQACLRNLTLKMPSTSTAWELRTDATGQNFFTHPQSQDMWVAAESEDGRPYFYEKNSRISLWELPQLEEVAEEKRKSSSISTTLEKPTINTINLTEAREKFGARPPHSSVSKASSTLGSGTKNRHSMMDSIDPTFDEGRFAVHRITKDHITGPLDNKIVASERRGVVQRTKFTVNRTRIQKKWFASQMVVSGPNIYFYKDPKSQSPNNQLQLIKSLPLPLHWITSFIKPMTSFTEQLDFFNSKSSIQPTKPELELKVKNVHILPADKSHTSRDNVFILVDSTNKENVVEYLIQTPSSDLLKSWEMALRYSQDWVDQNRFGYTAYATRPPPSVDSKIITTLREFFRKRPTREALQASGILQNEPVFGASLIDLCEQEHSTVPSFVARVIRAIEARGLEHTGLYRLSGNSTVIQKLRNKVNHSTDYALNSDEWDIYELTDSLKLFLRELKEPLFCFTVFEELREFNKTFKQFTDSENISRCQKILAKFPMYHYATTKVIFEHLKKVAAKSEFNNMTAGNLSMMFGPNVLWPENLQLPLIEYANVGYCISDFLILNWDRLFV